MIADLLWSWLISGVPFINMFQLKSQKVWNEIIYLFPNFNGATVEIWEWIRNFISYITENVIAYPWWD